MSETLHDFSPPRLCGSSLPVMSRTGDTWQRRTATLDDDNFFYWLLLQLELLHPKKLTCNMTMEKNTIWRCISHKNGDSPLPSIAMLVF